MNDVYFTILVGATSLERNNIEVKVCNPDVTNQYVDKINLSIHPYPVKVKAGETFQIDFAIDVLKEIHVGASISVELHLGLLPFPCINVSYIKVS